MSRLPHQTWDPTAPAPDALELRPADHGGFLVISQVPTGYVPGFLFAGSLKDCLAYMEERYSGPPKLLDDGIGSVCLDSLIRGGASGKATAGASGGVAGLGGFAFAGAGDGKLEVETNEFDGLTSRELQAKLTSKEIVGLMKSLTDLKEGAIGSVVVKRHHAEWILRQIYDAELAPWTTEIWRALSTAITEGREASIRVTQALSRVTVTYAGASEEFTSNTMLHDATMWLAGRMKTMKGKDQ